MGTESIDTMIRDADDGYVLGAVGELVSLVSSQPTTSADDVLSAIERGLRGDADPAAWPGYAHIIATLSGTPRSWRAAIAGVVRSARCHESMLSAIILDDMERSCNGIL